MALKLRPRTDRRRVGEQPARVAVVSTLPSISTGGVSGEKVTATGASGTVRPAGRPEPGPAGMDRATKTTKTIRLLRHLPRAPAAQGRYSVLAPPASWNALRENSATRSSSARIASAERDRRFSPRRMPQRLVGRPPAHMRIVERHLEVGVRDERHAAGERDLRLLLHPRRDRRASSIPTRNDDATTAIVIEPASAVPIDAPSSSRVLDPADLGLWRPHHGHRDGAELRGERADAQPDQEHRPEDDLGPELAASAASRTTVPARSAKRPARTMSLGETCESTRGTPSAAINSVSESGSRRTPISSAESPRHTERSSGTTKNSPACARNWKKKHHQAPFSCLLRASPRGRAARRHAPRRVLPAEEPDHEEAGEDEPDGGREARPRRAVGLGLDPAPHARARTPNTSRPRPSARAPRRPRRAGGRCCDRRVRDRLVMSRMPSTTTTSPAKTQRQEKYVVQKPPTSGPTATGSRRPPRRGRRRLVAAPAEVPGTSDDDRRKDQSRADALEERPAKSNVARFCEMEVMNEPQP